MRGNGDLKIGIIIINYKDYAKRFLDDCRDSLRKIDYPKDKYIVYIVDNATSPESHAFLKQMYPEAVVLPNQENSGWGGGNNAGIEQALKDGCKDVVLANMDVIVERDWLKELVKAAYNDDRIGIIQSKLLLHPIKDDGVVRTNSLGNQIHFLGFGYAGGNGELDVKCQMSNVKCQVSDIPYASGASMYVKGEVFRKVGLCNPDFFMYHDDMELCLKAKMAGYRVVLAPESIMWHKYEFGRSMAQVYYMERNRLLTVLQFYKFPTLLLLAPAFLAMELGLLGAAIAGHYFKPKVRGWWYILNPRNWEKIKKERKKIQTLRIVSDRVLTRDFTGKILYQPVMNPVLRYIANPVLNLYWQIAKRLIVW